MRYRIKNNAFPNLPERLSGLGELAENLWWSWNPQSRMLFKMLDRPTWKESGHNPDHLLKTLSRGVFEAASRDTNYLRHYDLVMSQFRRYLSSRPINLDRTDRSREAKPIAYFSAEYGLHHSLPFYAGGLGFLAGDHLKECSDLSIPLVAVGFMYPSGYLRQVINRDGWQESLTQKLDREDASINHLVDEQGRRVVVRVPVFQTPLHVAIWKVSVGKVMLFLMDTDIPENESWSRGISQRLYTSNLEQRLLQEIILGIGGSQVLRTLGIDCSMLHLNEGHAAFALLESIRLRVQQGADFETAREELKSRSLFTTHTPVSAGHDVFPFELIRKYFTSYWTDIGLDESSFLDLGRHPDRPQEGFNMTVLAMKLSGARNAVSRRHGEITRSMWQSLWPDRSLEEVPIGHVTNGVHLPTWLEPKIKLLFERYFGSGWIDEHDNPLVWEFVEEIPDDELWQIHYWLKMKLINYVRHRARQRWAHDRIDPSQVVASGTLLEPSLLTLGFARRFATYKRADLVFEDMEQLKTIIKNPWRPVQIIFAGKAHPADDGGKRLIQKIYNLARDPDLQGRVAFVENYNEQLAQYMLHGVDVWLNTPEPPLEASGTSGMKAAINGVPHFSLMDGWWIEGYRKDNGWTFGEAETVGKDRNQRDAEDFYRVLANEIIPLYYQVSENGTPLGWVKVMKQAIKSVAPQFSARRMVKEYLARYYSKVLPDLGPDLQGTAASSLPED